VSDEGGLDGLSDAGQFELFSSCHCEHSRAEMVWDYYARVHHRLALKREWLRTNVHSDQLLLHFTRRNSLLAVLEPVLARNGRHIMRELFLANFVATFSHHADLGKLAQNVGQASGQAATALELLSCHAAVVESALQHLELQSYTRQFISAHDNRSENESLSCSDESNLPSAGLEVSPATPSCKDCDVGTQAGELEAAAFAYCLSRTCTSCIA
jgi:hypothetical protein